jgi:hypothetical protein
MDATTLLVTVYCLIDEWLAGRRLRQRGPNPILADSEVLTIECVGEFWGIDTDKGLDEYFRRHWGGWFPALGRVHRTTFVRQAARPEAHARHGPSPAVELTDVDSALLSLFPLAGVDSGAAWRPGATASITSASRQRRERRW